MACESDWYITTCYGEDVTCITDRYTGKVECTILVEDGCKDE